MIFIYDTNLDYYSDMIKWLYLFIYDDDDVAEIDLIYSYR